MRKLLTKTDIVIVLLLLCTALLLLIFCFGGNGQKAVVKYKGKTVEEIDLNDNAYYETLINNVHIVRENGEIYVKDSSCPDKVCVRTGHISKTGESAVCVPNRVSVTITGGKKGPQAVTG
ncbi:MAG: NusG domain II-containing protein [Clostridiales bacterium]|nr:NusG domain II-containing protein [Clostridiales bacterium]